jgi:hypothetical protein
MLMVVVANASDYHSLGRSTIRVASRPEWLDLEPAAIEIEGIDSEAEAVASFSFVVHESAPVAQPETVVLSIEAASGLVWTRTVRIMVEAPGELAVGIPTPNPLRGSTTLAYELPAAARVQMTVVDLTGREIAQLADAHQEAGRHEVSWRPAGVASGVYVWRVVVEDADGNRTVHNRKVTLLR